MNSSRPRSFKLYLMLRSGDRGGKEKMDDGVRGEGRATACELPLVNVMWLLLEWFHGANNKLWSSFPSGDSTSTIVSFSLLRCILPSSIVFLVVRNFYFSIIFCTSQFNSRARSHWSLINFTDTPTLLPPREGWELPALKISICECADLRFNKSFTSRSFHSKKIHFARAFTSTRRKFQEQSKTSRDHTHHIYEWFIESERSTCDNKFVCSIKSRAVAMISSPFFCVLLIRVSRTIISSICLNAEMYTFKWNEVWPAATVKKRELHNQSEFFAFIQLFNWQQKLRAI